MQRGWREGVTLVRRPQNRNRDAGQQSDASQTTMTKKKRRKKKEKETAVADRPVPPLGTSALHRSVACAKLTRELK